LHAAATNARELEGIVMKLLSLLLVLFLLGGGLPSINTPESAVKDFYSTVMKIPKAGVPDKNELRLLAPFLSKKLTSLFRDAFAFREQFIKDNPPKILEDGMRIEDKPPFCDGDIFSSNFEGATSFDVGKSYKSGSSYRIDLHLVYIDKSGKVSWTDAIYVIEENGRFVVDDMKFLGTWDFGNHGMLSKILLAR
jgi:hypothetical protein